MTARAAASAAAHRRLKRAMGLLRAAAPILAQLERDADFDFVAEHHLPPDASTAELQELIELARHRHGALDVVILAAPRPPADA